MKRTRNLVIVLIALAVFVASAVAIGRNKKDAIPVRMVTIGYHNFSVKLPENGVVMRPHTEVVPALVSGNVGTIDVRPGQYVVAGELLATIYNPTLQFDAQGAQADYRSSVADVATAKINEQNAKVQYQAQVDTTKSQLNLAKQTYAADVSLYRQSAIPHTQLETDRAKLDQAQVAYDQALEQLRLGAVSGYGQNSVQAARAAARKAQIVNAQNQADLGFTRITAPFSGVVMRIATDPSDALRSIEPGDQVAQGQALFTIAQGDRFIVKAEVDEQDIINVRVGQRAIISGEDFGNHTMMGRIVAIAPIAVKSADASSTAKQVLTTVVLDQDPSYLRDGMTADVDILTTDRRHVLLVPNDAIFTAGGHRYVYVDVHGVARKRRVELGTQGDTRSIVLAGLKAGDLVVDDKSAGVTDGSAVTLAPSPSPSPLAT
jgi:HlyD family secretion protein